MFIHRFVGLYMMAHTIMTGRSLGYHTVYLPTCYFLHM